MLASHEPIPYPHLVCLKIAVYRHSQHPLMLCKQSTDSRRYESHRCLSSSTIWWDWQMHSKMRSTGTKSISSSHYTNLSGTIKSVIIFVTNTTNHINLISKEHYTKITYSSSIFVLILVSQTWKVQLRLLVLPTFESSIRLQPPTHPGF
jgi:hypothetical protein